VALSRVACCVRDWLTDRLPLPRRRKYHERVNYLVQQYLYIDRLLDSSLPHDLLNEYNNMTASAFRGVEVPATILESSSPSTAEPARKVLRTPKGIYRPTETTPLFSARDGAPDSGAVDDSDDGQDVEAGLQKPDIPWLEDDVIDSDAPIVTLAIYVNFAANAILLAGKFAVVLSVPSVSVLASLVDALLDFLSTVIVWVTTWLIRHQDQYRYPVGRRRLEPLGVLVFSVIMITSFVQVALEAIQRLASTDHNLIQLCALPPSYPSTLRTSCIRGCADTFFEGESPPSQSCWALLLSRVCAGCGAAWSTTRACKHCQFSR